MRDAIINRARFLGERVIERHGLDPAGACLFWAGAVVIAAADRGVTLVLQAGTAHWRRLPAHLDDGEPTTLSHFGYEWQGLEDPTTQGMMSLGAMPEMHVWAGDVAAQEVVDLSARYQPERCRRNGLEWLTPPLPDPIWGKPPEGSVYIADRDATLLAHRLLIEAMEETRR